MIKSIDISGIEGDEIRIALVSTTGLALIDSVVVDYSADEAVTTTDLMDGDTECTDNVCLTLLSATTAVDNNAVDVAPEIFADDDDYLIQEKEDYTYLSFDEVPAHPTTTQ